MHERMEYIHTGIIAANIVNFSMGHPEKPVSPLDFVPEIYRKLEGGQEEFDLRKLSPEKQAEFVKNTMFKKVFRRRK